MAASISSSLIAAAHGYLPCAVLRCRARPAASARPRRRAFTLIEVLFVAAILSIIAGIAAPRYAASLTQYRLDAAARRIQVDIASARAAARAQSASVTVQFGINVYQISPMTGLDGATSNKVNMRADPYKLDSFSHDLGADSALVFNGYGAPSRGGTITLRAGGGERRIVVDPSTGDTSVER